MPDAKVRAPHQSPSSSPLSAGLAAGFPCGIFSLNDHSMACQNPSGSRLFSSALGSQHLFLGFKPNDFHTLPLTSPCGSRAVPPPLRPAHRTQLDKILPPLRPLSAVLGNVLPLPEAPVGKRKLRKLPSCGREVAPPNLLCEIQKLLPRVRQVRLPGSAPKKSFRSPAARSPGPSAASPASLREVVSP